MKINKSFAILASSAMMLMAMPSCNENLVIPQSDQNPDQEPTTEVTNPRLITNLHEIKDYIASLQEPTNLSRERVDNSPVELPAPAPKLEPGISKDGVPGFWVTTTRKYKMTQSFDETILLDPTTFTMYPGCAIDGRSIANNTYAPISDATVGMITFSISKVLNNEYSSDALVASRENIRMSEYRKVFNEWSKLDYKPNAFITTHEFYTVASSKEAMFRAGATVNNSMFDLSSSLKFNFSQRKNHFLVKFIQKQFSVTMDVPKTPTIFTSIDPMYMQEAQPVYVSNINYGRIVYMTIDTDEKKEDIEAAINFVLKKVKGFDVSADLATKYTETLSKSDINMTVVGGGNAIQSKVLKDGIDGIYEYMTADIPINEMTPISFQLNYALDNSLARVVSSTEYEVTKKDFVPDFSKMVVEFEVDGFRAKGDPYGYESEIYGQIYTEYNGEKQFMFDRSGENKGYLNVKGDWQWQPYSGNKVAVIFTKPDNMTVDEFLTTTRMKIEARLIEDTNGAWAYTPVTIEESLASLSARVKAADPHMYMDTGVGRNSAGVRVKVSSVSFLSKEGKQVVYN